MLACPGAHCPAPAHVWTSPGPAGVYDALSAKILQRSGHKAGFVSGAGVSSLLRAWEVARALEVGWLGA